MNLKMEDEKCFLTGTFFYLRSPTSYSRKLPEEVVTDLLLRLSKIKKYQLKIVMLTHDFIV